MWLQQTRVAQQTYLSRDLLSTQQTCLGTKHCVDTNLAQTCASALSKPPIQPWQFALLASTGSPCFVPLPNLAFGTARSKYQLDRFHNLWHFPMERSYPLVLDGFLDGMSMFHDVSVVGRAWWTLFCFGVSMFSSSSNLPSMATPPLPDTPYKSKSKAKEKTRGPNASTSWAINYEPKNSKTI